MTGRVIAMRIDVAEECGLAAAVVHQQIWHHIDYADVIARAHRPGWFTGTSEEVAALCPLSAPQVRRAMATLVDAGLMERRKWRSSQGDHTVSYRPVEPAARARNPLKQRSDDSVRSGSDDSVTSGSDDSVRSTSNGKNGNKTPPVVPLGEGDGHRSDGTLFDDDPTTRRRERVAAHEQASAIVEASFASWWENYPSGKARGSRAAALKAWRRVLTKGVDRNGDPITTIDLHQRLDNYRAARAAYHDRWKAEGVEARVPLMHGSTFINSKSEMWDHEWSMDDVAAYWPPPRGRSWDDTGRGESLQDILKREIAAEEAAKARKVETVGQS